MKMSEAFPSKYLKAGDLKGREIKLTIDRCELEDVTGKNTEWKPILYFKRAQKGLVLNKTNADKIAAAYGDDSESWREKEVMLYPDKTQYNGQLVDCLRVRIPGQQVSADSESVPF